MAMMLAARAGHPDIVELLWPYECCGKDGENHDAYWYAQGAGEGGARIREILEGQGKDCHDEASILAAREGRIPLLGRHIDDARSPRMTGRTPKRPPLPVQRALCLPGDLQQACKDNPPVPTPKGPQDILHSTLPLPPTTNNPWHLLYPSLRP